MKKTIITFLSPIFFTTAIAQETTKNKFGNGILNVIASDSSWSMKLETRFQTQYNGNWTINDTAGVTEGTSNFRNRRIRLKMDGFIYRSTLTYKVEFGFSNSDLATVSTQNKNEQSALLDILVKWNFYKNITLYAGQSKFPSNREDIMSTAELNMVESSLLSNEFRVNRDFGFQLRHQFKISDKLIVKESAAVSQGEGKSLATHNLGGYQWTGRLEILPLGAFEKNGDYIGRDLVREKSPKLAIATTFNSNVNAVKTKSNYGKYMINDVGFFETDIYTLIFDMMFKYQGITVLAEYANRDAENPIAKNSNGTKTGSFVNVGKSINAELGYFFKNNWAISTRYTYLQLDKKITNEEIKRQYGFCVSKYIVGSKLKIQSDISYTDIHKSSDNELMLGVQLEIGF